MLHRFNFAFNTPSLTTGVTVLNPTPGDILLDAWVEVDTAFNGTTPHADIGDFNGANTGWFAEAGQIIDLSVADAAAGSGPLLLNKSVVGGRATDLAAEGFAGQLREVPGKFQSPAPVLLVVSQNGQKGGTATGATAGLGVLYLLTATPA